MESYTQKTVKIDGCTFIINRPILTDAERHRAEERIKQALSGYSKG